MNAWTIFMIISCATLFYTASLGFMHYFNSKKLAELKLLECKNSYKMIFDSSHDVLLQLDKKGVVMDVNRTGVEVVGVPKEKLVGRHVLELAKEFMPDSAQLIIEQYQKRSTGDEIKPYEAKVKDKNGSEYYVEINSVPLKDTNGLIIGQLIVLHNISDTKKVAIDRESLIKKIEDVNRKKTEFVSDVSHELRTPLASIKGFVATIRDEKDMDPVTREDFLKIVEEESDRLTRIIEDLLDLSRIEAGRLKLNKIPLEIEEVIRKNIEALKMQARVRAINIEHLLSPRLPLVLADQDKTAQVIINLLSNAIKYNKEGGKVVVSACEDGCNVRVDVEDTGMGISDRDLPHMFEKFYRVEKYSHDTPGTGLGLAVTKSLVELMGGEINVQSKPGIGSKFSFYLPKASARQKELIGERA